MYCAHYLQLVEADVARIGRTPRRPWSRKISATSASSVCESAKRSVARWLQPPARHRSGAAKKVPISVFVSRKLSGFFVRQRFTAFFDAPIRIENPDEPLGIHV
jgi:hypothetical protein